MSNHDKRFLAALERMALDPQPVQINLSKSDLWCLLASVQMACRNKHFKGPTRENIERLARRLGEPLVANDADLRLLFAAGWEESFDVNP